MFAGRETQLKYLNYFYQQEGSKILVVYGQKGIGKTALLTKFASAYEHSMYVARPVSGAEQKNLWEQELSAGVQETGETDCKSLLKRMINPFSSKKQVLILDEFQYLVKSDSTFFTQLISFASEASVLVLLSSSQVAWVENDMVAELGRQAAAVNGLLKVKELGFQDILKCHPETDFDTLAGYYAVLGGSMSLWQGLDVSLPLKEGILRNMLPVCSRLHEQMESRLGETLRETSVYNTILLCLAKGSNKLNEIYRHTGFSRAKISVYLKNLMTLGYVEKIFSFELGNHAQVQKGVYRISDPFLLFYFRFLFEHLTHLYTMDAETFYDTYIAPGLAWIYHEGYVRICKEYLGSKMVHVGEWSGKTGTIDIVCRDAKNRYYVAKCCALRSAAKEDLEELKSLASIAQIKPFEYVLFSEEGFELPDGQENQLLCISLKKEL